MLTDANGKPVDLDSAQTQFAAAMAAPETSEPTAPAPPTVDPAAPYGRRADGTPKKGPGGRPSTKRAAEADKPRVADVPPAAAADGGKDYTPGLLGLADIVHGAMLISERTHAHAALWRGSAPGMAMAWNQAAQSNAQVRRAVGLLVDGNTAWVTGVVVATYPFAQAAYALWRAPESEVAQKLAAQSRNYMEQMAQLQHDAILAAAGVAA